MDNTVTTLVKLVNPPSLICRGVFLLESQASVRQTALLLPRHGLRALLDDRLRVLDVILAGSQGGECQSLCQDEFHGNVSPLSPLLLLFC